MSSSVTSTVDWCEKNYEVVSFIAEFWNTISSLMLLYAGAYGMLQHWNLKGNIIFLVLAIVGIGSVFFHGTLTLFTQMMDEIPMIFLVTQLVLNTMNVKKYIYVAYVYATIYSMLIFLSSFAIYKSYTIQFYLFQSSIIISAIAILIALLKVPRTQSTRYLFSKGLIFFFTGWSCWLMDYFLCDILQNWCAFNPQFHAWWHVFSAFGVYNLSLISIMAKNGVRNFTVKKTWFYPVIMLVTQDESKFC